MAKEKQLGYLEGALIDSGDTNTDPVLPNSPASVAGLMEGDIILEVNGEKIAGGRSLAKMILSFRVGDRIKLKIARGNEVFEVIVTLDAHPPRGF